VELGWVFTGQYEFEQALDSATKALALDGGHVTALALSVTARRLLGRFSEAQAAAREAISQRPDSPALLVELGLVLAARYDDEQALDCYRQALLLDPHQARARLLLITTLRLLRRFNEAEAAAREAISQRPDRPDLLVELGRVFHDQYDFQAAEDCYDQALVLDPRHVDALRWRVRALRLLRRFSEAQAAAREAVSQRPDRPDLLVELGRVGYDQYEFEEALNRCDQALVLDPRHAEALRWRITALRALRRFGAAEAAAREAISRRPDSPDLLVELGLALSGRYEFGPALDCYDQALELDPRQESAQRWRITALRALRRFGAAETAAREAVSQHPDSPDLLVELGRVFDDQYDYEQALDSYRKALELDPGHADAQQWRITALRRLRRFGEAEAAAREALGQRPDSLDLLVELGWAHYDQYEFEQALDCYDQVLALDPGHADALRWRVSALRALRRFSPAETAAREAVSQRPDRPDLLVELGWVFDDQYDYAQALDCYDRALVLDPRHADALRWRVSALRGLRRFGPAETAAGEAISQRPDSPDLLVELGYVFYSQYYYERALDSFNQALVLDPRHADAQLSRVTALGALRRFGEAEAAAREAVSQRPDSPGPQMELGWIFNYLGRFDDALACFTQAQQLDPRNLWASQCRIRALRWLRRSPDAEAAAREALGQRPGHPDLLVELGWVFHDRYDFQAAQDCYAQALSACPRHESAQQWLVAALRGLGRWDAALMEARHGIQALPYATGSLIECGRVLDDRLEFALALSEFDSACRLNPRDPAANLGRSSVLRSVRRYAEAEREISKLVRDMPQERALLAELGWIQHDAQRLTEAGRTFSRLAAESVSDDEEATGLRGLGWVAFAAGDYLHAEDKFRQARTKAPHDLTHQLDLAWALVRQADAGRWTEAEDLCLGILNEYPGNPFAHVCLGVLAFQRKQIPASEYHLKKALEIDPYHGSHTDLGALYVQIGRHDDAVQHLTQAIEQDWYNAQPHVELGNLYLQTGRPQEAILEFQRALAIEPDGTAAALGLAQAFSALGADNDAEAALRRTLQSGQIQRPWQLQVALARLLLIRGDKLQSGGLYAEAYAQAQLAIGAAPDREADPHFIAAIAHYKLGTLATDLRGSTGYRRRALKHLQHCLDRDPGNIEAQRAQQLLEPERAAARTAALGGVVIAGVALSLLSLLWTTFLLNTRVTVVMVTTITPILVGLVAVSVLLPSLVKLKLPGFEADLDSGPSRIPSGPTGDVALGPGKFTVAAGPTGQLARRA
jgi:tetratricopeptide (TPR) repeat protein